MRHLLTGLGFILVLSGCSPEIEFRANELEWLKQGTMFLDGDTVADSTREEVSRTMLILFGTPDDARFPFGSEDGASQITWLDREHLVDSAGPFSSDQQGRHLGLYREHCSQCHGVTGDGAGPAAAMLNPYPRDFRLGKFKFKSTTPRHPPTDQDLRQILEHGIPGTAMPSFKRLPSGELDALIDYVKYLSVRGQWERYLIAEAVANPEDSAFSESRQRDQLLGWDADSGRAAREWRIVEPSALLDFWRPQFGELFEDRVLARWRTPEAAVKSVPPVPAALAFEDPGQASLVRKGQQLFQGKGACYQCHGVDGTGGGEVVNYDDWTNDWLAAPGVDPEQRETWRQFRNAGALRPRPAAPRNLQLGIFRGGDSPETIFRRIACGIEGSPMPAATALTDTEIWALVAYVRSLSGPGPGSEGAPTQVAQAPARAWQWQPAAHLSNVPAGRSR